LDLTLCQDEKYIASAGRDKAIIIWDFKEKNKIYKITDAHSD
jgi:WD40 repeat protein